MIMNITNQKDGVKAILSGFKTDELNAKIELCKSGECACSCDPAMMQKIKSIDVAGQDGFATITITGDVDAQTLAPMMQECLIGEKQ